MSLKHEQYRSLCITREFLFSILTSPRRTQKELRRLASSCLRHYPILRANGEPMFSSDDFPCPGINVRTEGCVCGIINSRNCPIHQNVTDEESEQATGGDK